MLQVVCGVIEDSEGRVLACQRPAGKHLGGMWEFPGGKIDPGESAADALVRELKEELAVDVEVERALTPVTWSYGEITIHLQPFMCRIIAGELQALEHEKLHWCGAGDYSQLSWAPADVPILCEIFPER